jgi:ATP-dependent Lon protease
MKRKPASGKSDTVQEKIPGELPILPVRKSIVFPFSIQSLSIGVPRSVKLIEEAASSDRVIGLVASKDPSIDEPSPSQVHEVGTVARILRVIRLPDGTMNVSVQGLERFRVNRWLRRKPPSRRAAGAPPEGERESGSYLKARVRLEPEAVERDLELDALRSSLRDLALEVISLSPNIPNEAGIILSHVDDPRLLVYLIASNIGLEAPEGQKLLEMDSLKEKMRVLVSKLTRMKDVLSLGAEIKTKAEEEMGKEQREYLLRQQLKAIQSELGELDEKLSVEKEYEEKIGKARMPEEARKEAQSELKRLSSMSPQAAEYSMMKTYLDWMVELPWSEVSEDRLDIGFARKVLDEDHYDLQEVKERIVEYLAVRALRRERGAGPERAAQDGGKVKRGEAEREKSDRGGKALGAILCFVGPPGVGKTSLGQSIARALGRAYTRMSLGGMRDEAEIRGHRRTYIGAMPGRIIQAIKRAGTRNPVFMLDEVDKIGADWRGDPSSALLEVLDPAQNRAFRDNYLNVDFDLSDVMFITTANLLEPIPPPLLDRMEIIRLDGYTEQEKVRIAQGYLVPRQLEANGLRDEEVSFTDEAIRKIIREYTREAGVRNLERQIGAVCRKCVVSIAERAKPGVPPGTPSRGSSPEGSGELSPTPAAVVIDPETVFRHLKRGIFETERSESTLIPGIATGLAVTVVGGEILFIEATSMRGKGDLTVTGQLGDVMRESTRIAYSYVRSKASELGVDREQFERSDVHIHVPAGAIPKDGPSAGVAMVLALTSLFSGRSVRGDTGMTGEITLRGRVLPVGGIKMKVLAAHRAGLKEVILPKRNARDLDEIPEDVRGEMRIVLVEHIDEALRAALSPGAEKDKREQKIA